MNPSDSVSRPNILLIMADQLTAGALGTYEHPIVRTANIDALASRGTTFDRFYCNSPICAASRASMMTGRFPHGVGVYDNGSELSASIPTFVHFLRQEGYQTALAGKMHFIGPDQLHGFESRLTTDIYPASFAWTPDWDLGVVLNEGSNVKPLRDSGKCLWNLQLSYDEEVQSCALAHLRGEAKRLESDPSKPFFLCASFTHPHDPFVTTREWWDLYRDDEITFPTVPGRPSEDLHPYSQWLQRHHGVDEFPLSDQQIRDARHAYYGMVSYFDHKVGELVAELRRLDLYDNTLIIVTSDHGEMLGEHGMWFKRTFYEDSIRVPLIMCWEGTIPAGQRIEQITSLVDLFPTLCEVGQVPAAQMKALSLHGRSLYPLLTSNSTLWMDRAYIEYCGEGVLRPMRAVRTRRHKYVIVDGHSPQLFDLESDPHEVRDLSGQPHMAEIERELAELVVCDWPTGLTDTIQTSQKQRRLINTALRQGRHESWDYQVLPDDARRYIRESTQGEKIRSRLPYVV
jgi:choline-sulfatase